MTYQRQSEQEPEAWRESALCQSHLREDDLCRITVTMFPTLIMAIPVPGVIIRYFLVHASDHSHLWSNPQCKPRHFTQCNMPSYSAFNDCLVVSNFPNLLSLKKKHETFRSFCKTHQKTSHHHFFRIWSAWSGRYNSTANLRLGGKLWNLTIRFSNQGFVIILRSRSGVAENKSQNSW